VCSVALALLIGRAIRLADQRSRTGWSLDGIPPQAEAPAVERLRHRSRTPDG